MDDVELDLSNVGVKNGKQRIGNCHEGARPKVKDYNAKEVEGEKKISGSAIHLYYGYFIAISTFSGNNDDWLTHEIRHNSCPSVKDLNNGSTSLCQFCADLLWLGFSKFHSVYRHSQLNITGA
jgi:hypothetical protein